MVYLVTGANRGIGLEITTLLLQRPSTTVIATVREDTTERTASLSVLPAARDSIVIILTHNLFDSPESLMTTIKYFDIWHIDVVIANAGNSCAFKSVLETNPQELRDDFDTNCVAVLRLFQHCWPMMKAAPRQNRKFVLISSTMGSIDNLEVENLPGLAYGASKAAANWLAKKISVELKPHVDVGIFHPGWVQTGMGQLLADAIGLDKPPMTAQESAPYVVRLIDNLGPENSGQFLMYNGERVPW
jgi:NAD(P)-dependent dehydrogenase (short-subunit alcohol dehydrogenase family)